MLLTHQELVLVSVASVRSFKCYFSPQKWSLVIYIRKAQRNTLEFRRKQRTPLPIREMADTSHHTGTQKPQGIAVLKRINFPKLGLLTVRYTGMLIYRVGHKDLTL